MKIQLLIPALAVLFFCSMSSAYPQCTPGDETTCPDLENNGEICPETLPDGTFEEFYSQDFTILAPPEYVLDSATGAAIELHHLVLKNVNNLPPGIGWESNSTDSVFMVGTYYCVLLEGIPEEEGFFPLAIEVDVYIPGIFGSPPIYVATVTDSTSLSITVSDPSNTAEYLSGMSHVRMYPNPFREAVELEFNHEYPEELHIEICDLVGTTVFSRTYQSAYGPNKISLDGRMLKAGVYFVTVRNERGSFSSRIIKSD